MESAKEGFYDILCELAATVSSAADPASVLQSIVQKVTDALRAKACSVMLLTPDRKLLLHTASHGLSDRYVRLGPVSADKSIPETLEGRPVAVLDATRDKRIQYRKQAKQEGIVSILSVPMVFRGEIIGVVRVYTGEPRQFTVDDACFVQTIANLGGSALAGTWLVGSAENEVSDDAGVNSG